MSAFFGKGQSTTDRLLGMKMALMLFLLLAALHACMHWMDRGGGHTYDKWNFYFVNCFLVGKDILQCLSVSDNVLILTPPPPPQSSLNICRQGRIVSECGLYCLLACILSSSDGIVLVCFKGKYPAK